MNEEIYAPLTSAGFSLQLSRALAVVVSSAQEMTELEEKFNDILLAHETLISRICYNYTSREEDYQDLRQEVLVNIWRGLKNFEGRSLPSTWITRICINTALTSLRKCSFNAGNKDHIESLGDECGTSDAFEARDTLRHLLSRLPLIDRGIMMMWLNGDNYGEIAAALGMQKSNVAVRIHRARLKMKSPE